MDMKGVGAEFLAWWKGQMLNKWNMGRLRAASVHARMLYVLQWGSEAAPRWRLFLRWGGGLVKL